MKFHLYFSRALMVWIIALSFHGVWLSAATVTVDGNTKYQIMDGFGSSQRPFEDKHIFSSGGSVTIPSSVVLTTEQQNEVLNLLYRDLRLTRVRPILYSNFIEPVNDNTDPQVIDWTKLNFTFVRNDANVEYVKRVRPLGVKTFFISPVKRPNWLGAVTPNDVEEYTEWLMTQLIRWDQLGARLPFINVANEPSYNLNTASPEFIRDVIKILGPKMRNAGFDTKIVVNDDVRSSDAERQCKIILADPEARQYVGALATHLYDEPYSNISKMKVLSDQYSLPLWMTEFSCKPLSSAGLQSNAPGRSWARLMHDLIAEYNVSAIDYMWGFFGTWDGATSLVTLSSDSSTNYTGYTLPKAYHVTGHYSRFVDPGAQRILTQSNDPNIKVSAFKNSSSTVIVALNLSFTNQVSQFNLSGLSGVTTMSSYWTSFAGAENWATPSSIPVSELSFTATLQPQSITTFVSNDDGAGDDSDLDGLPDAWEFINFGSIADPRAQAAADPDGDGHSNLSEYSAGTSPVNGSSRLVITDQVFSSPTSFQIQWQSVVDKIYDVQSSTDMTNWTTITSLRATSASSMWIDSGGGVGKKFYRVRIP